MRLTRDQAEIKVDWDNPIEPDLSEMHRLLARAGYAIHDTALRRSPSGTGWHVVFEVEPRPTSPYEVIALQLLLGGDKNREAMQMHRARAFSFVPRWMRDKWNVLYVAHPHRQRHVKLPESKLELVK